MIKIMVRQISTQKAKPENKDLPLQRIWWLNYSLRRIT